jgi:hypothetical protein
MKTPSKLTVLCIAAFGLVAAGSGFAQVPDNTTGKTEQPQLAVAAAEPAAPQVLKPAVDSVRDIELGMTVEQVKAKLGKPDVEDKTGLYFTLDKGDSVQIGLDADKKVRTVAAIYGAGSKDAPSFTDIFGTDAAAPEGDVYKLERYPDAGYWVSYSRTNSKDKPVTVIMLRKIF